MPLILLVKVPSQPRTAYHLHNKNLVEITMATDAVRSQVAAKWQESFNRLNGSAPGISGLLTFSEVTFLYSSRVIVQIFKVWKHHKAWRIATQFLYPRDIRIVGLEGVRQGKLSNWMVLFAFFLIFVCLSER